jgi:primary-amine oxidase
MLSAMRQTTRPIRLALGAGVLLVATACSDGGTSSPDGGEHPGTAADNVVRGGRGDCAKGTTALARKLSSGATWTLCFEVDAHRGMVLTDVRLAPPGAAAMPIAKEISLAQLEVPYDTGARLTSDITSAGFGGLKMRSLTKDECAGSRITIGIPDIGDGSTFGDIHERPVLCSEVTDAGLAYRSEENGKVVAARHDAWTLSTISKVGWYEYVTRYTFGSDGSINPSLGATGDLSPVDFPDDQSQGEPVGKDDADRAATHSHNAVWRVHWALGGGDLRAEQYDATPTGRSGPQSPILRGGLVPVAHPATADRADRRWWRVVAPETPNDDGHPVSYEIDLGATDSFAFAHDEAQHKAAAGYDVAFTNADACEVFATRNRGSCGSGVLEYVADSRSEPLIDVVSWIAVGFHHVPRDEDQSPMQLHWQGFTLTPRNLTAQRLDVPAGREDLNGQPETWNGESVEELERSGAGLGQ